VRDGDDAVTDWVTSFAAGRGIAVRNYTKNVFSWRENLAGRRLLQIEPLHTVGSFIGEAASNENL